MSDSPRLGRFYLYSVASLTLLLPLVSVAIAKLALASPSNLWDLTGTWFVFWAVGVRQLAAGLRQSSQPSFTAREIFGIQDRESEPLVRELGFANLCMGSGVVLALFIPSWWMGTSFIGGLYFGLAGLMHLIKKPNTPNEQLALWSDLFILVVVACCFAHRWLAATAS
jgi:hypothetical protein